MGDKSVNRSLGSQWENKYKRAQSIEDRAKAMQASGQGKDKLKVELKRCKPPIK